jgi:hypothetical protein
MRKYAKSVGAPIMCIGESSIVKTRLRMLNTESATELTILNELRIAIERETL